MTAACALRSEATRVPVRGPQDVRVFCACGGRAQIDPNQLAVRWYCTETYNTLANPRHREVPDPLAGYRARIARGEL